LNKIGLFKSQSFLIELIFTILFFALCSVICILAFAKAEIISRDGYELNRSLLLTQSVAECIKASDLQSLDYNMEKILLLSKKEGGGYESYYDENFASVPLDISYFGLNVDIEIEDGMLISVIRVEKQKSHRWESVCQLEVKRYLPQEWWEVTDEF
jgi:hypothetical protein